MNQLQIITLANAIICAVAAVLGKDNDLFPTITPKWRGVIVSALSIVTAGLQLVLTDKVTLSEAMITAATAGISGFIVVLAAAISSAKAMAASERAGGVVLMVAAIGLVGSTTPGCAIFRSTLSDVHNGIQQVEAYEQDAATALFEAKLMVDAALAMNPDVPLATRKAISDAFEKATTELRRIIAVTKDLEDLTDENQLATIFGPFAKLWEDLQAVIGGLGLMGGPRGGQAVQVPQPIVCRLVAAHKAGAR